MYMPDAFLYLVPCMLLNKVVKLYKEDLVWVRQTDFTLSEKLVCKRGSSHPVFSLTRTVAWALFKEPVFCKAGKEEIVLCPIKKLS